MGQVSELKYGIYNSCILSPSERFYATPYDVQYLSHITAQVVIIKPSGTIANGQIIVDWYGTNGQIVSTRSSQTITPTQLWSRKTATFEVPTGAVKARLQFFGGAQGYHIACPMLEPGEIASAFSGEVASRLAYMSSEGGYFGLLNAGQIVAGKLLSPTDKMWIDLDKPEIVMKGVDADLHIDPANPIKVIDKENNFIGGITNIDNTVKFVAGALTNMENANSFAIVGSMPNPDGSGIMDEGIQFFVNIGPADNPSYIPSFFIKSEGHNLGSIVEMGIPNQDSRLSLYNLSPGYSVAQLYAYHSLIRASRQSIHLKIESDDPDVTDFVDLFLDFETGATMEYYNNGTLGIDNGGPYVIRKNGTKVYL
jgi:hypothetical protein